MTEQEKQEPKVPDLIADTPEAVECWHLNYPAVAKGGDLTPAEENTLARYCLLWAEWTETTANIKKYGKVLPKKDASGKVTSYKDRPEVARQRQLDATLRQQEKSLGLDSASRRRGEDDEGAGDQPKSSRGRADHLKKYQFKPGQSGNPKGLPKGTVSLTTKLKKLLQLPVRDGKKRANKNYTYADRFVEVMMEAALAKDHKFMKEIYERVEGKVPDHLVLENTKQLVSQEVAKFAHTMVTLVEEVSRAILNDSTADELMTALQAKVVAKFAEDAEEEEDEGEGGTDPDVPTPKSEVVYAPVEELMVVECRRCGTRKTIDRHANTDHCEKCNVGEWRAVPEAVPESPVQVPEEPVDEIPPAVPGDAADGQESE